MSEIPFQASDISEDEGELLEIDQELTDLIRSGMPALLTGCRHEPEVLKQGRLFLVSDKDGEVSTGCKCGMGLYHEDTRFLSHLTLRLAGQTPTLLSGSTERTNLGHIEFVNPSLTLADGNHVRQETMHLSLARVVSDSFREQVSLLNFNTFEVAMRISLEFRGDFADIFEVRGLHRQRHGVFYKPRLGTDSITLAYRGEDKLLRQTRIRFAVPPASIESLPSEHGAVGAVAHWDVVVPPNGGKALIDYQIDTLEGSEPPKEIMGFPALIQHVSGLGEASQFFQTQIQTDNAVFNLVLDRSIRDLVALTSRYPTGPFLSAGIPWFTSPFGRDALITAMQTLMLGPEVAKGVLRFLAKHQGKNEDEFRDEEPGKILHEFRYGELARLGVIPHTPYYGTVDATPLWIILLSETYRWTGDASLVHELWEAAEGALLWLETYGDLDDDMFVEYLRRSPKGIGNQGWKDSFNAVIFPDGSLAQSPIALVEVQGYVYDAKRRAAELCHLVGQELLAKRLLQEADELKARFNEAFWLAEDGFYAIALDRDKQPVRTLTSNPGHALWSNIIAAERIPQVVKSLLSPGMFSGWGIRTLSSESPVYNPIGYHIGTVWPHDNALIAKGFADRGFKREANMIFSAMYDSAIRFNYYRLPELYCGFERQGELDMPIPYPVACAPQAWAAATPILLLQAALGLEADAAHHTLKVNVPALPDWLGRVTLRGLRIGAAVVDLEFIQVTGTTTTRILNKQGDLRVLIEG
jgi:glycogen debranching enzyme